MTSTPLLTASWKAVMAYDEARRRTGGGAPGFCPVRTSVGTPRNPPPWVKAVPMVKEITPYGLLKLSPAEFWPAYDKRLEDAGVRLIQARFDGIYDFYGQPLVLLCFEADRKDCHRGAFATWWETKTGQHVPEPLGLDDRSIAKALEGGNDGR